MAKVCVIPDIHGSHEWEKAKDIKADYYVFLGDIVDSWENKHPDQVQNVLNFADWVREDPTHRIWLLGNHDWSYLSQSRDGSNCSGHQWEHAPEIRAALLANKDLIRLAFELDGWVFSHAGFSNYAVNLMKEKIRGVLEVHPKSDRTQFDSIEEYHEYMDKLYKDFKPWDSNEYSIDLLNKVFADRMKDYPENSGKWMGFDEKLDWDGFCSGSGDEVSQFCLWIRPHSLLKDPAYPKQIVGHTEYCFGNYVVWKNGENIAVICDSQNHRIYDLFDTQELPVNPVTEIDWQRETKKLDKRLGVIKSLFGMLKSETGYEVSEKDKRKKLIEEFGEIGNEYYELFFKKA